MANLYRGEVDFPLFMNAKEQGVPGFDWVEPGIHLRYRTGDLMALKGKFGKEYKSVIAHGLDASDPEVTMACLEAGLKKPDGSPLVMAKALKEDLPFDIGTPGQLVLEALSWVWTGKTFKELAEERAAMVKAIEDAGKAEGLDRPQTSMSSPGSSTPPQVALDGTPITYAN